MFCTLWRDAGVQIDSIGLPTLNRSIAFYTLWRHATVEIDSLGLPTVKMSIAFLATD